jgi:hypothetical protein
MEYSETIYGVSLANGAAALKLQQNHDGTYSVFLVHYGKHEHEDNILMQKVGIEIDADTLDKLKADWDSASCRWIPRQSYSVRADILFKILES